MGWATSKGHNKEKSSRPVVRRSEFQLSGGITNQLARKTTMDLNKALEHCVST